MTQQKFLTGRGDYIIRKVSSYFTFLNSKPGAMLPKNSICSFKDIHLEHFRLSILLACEFSAASKMRVFFFFFFSSSDYDLDTYLNLQ